MVAIRRKKKGSAFGRTALLAKLFLTIGFIWSMFALFFGSGFGSIPMINKINPKAGSIHDKLVVGVGNVRGGGGVIVPAKDHDHPKDEQQAIKSSALELVDTTANAEMEEEMEEEMKEEMKEEMEKHSHEEIQVRKDPLKPLRHTNQEIISSAGSVNLSYENMAKGHMEDPHRGAQDEYGRFGYRHDETALRSNPPPFEVTKTEVNCDNHDGNYKMLTQKVFVDIASHEAREREAEQDGEKPRAKIFCMVYTIQKNHDKIPIIRETWGQKCDGFIVASDKTDKNLGTVNIPHEGAEEYKNIWQKVRSMWSYVYDNYYEDYDWFHIGGDDLYVIVENMRLYLESEEVQLAANGGTYLPNGDEKEQIPLFLGRRFAEQGNYERIFNSGGSGYSINKAGLKALVGTFPDCMPHLRTFAEDVMVAQCFRNKLGVFPFDTKDDDGGERYMPFQPAHHLTYTAPANKKDDWYANYSIDIKYGLDHCSAQSVAFHYIKPQLMKRMHAILYGHCTE